MPVYRRDLHTGELVPLVEADDLSRDAVTTEKIVDGAVTADKIAADAVTGASISAGAVTVEKIANDSVSTDKIQDGAITEDKLSADVLRQLKIFLSTISLGFYHNDDPPTPLLMVQVRPGNVNVNIVPYLLLAQADISDHVTSWEWSRSSGYNDLDYAWNCQSKASQRTMNLTDNDFPSGWNLSTTPLSFSCKCSFEYEGVVASIINAITII